MRGSRRILVGAVAALLLVVAAAGGWLIRGSGHDADASDPGAAAATVHVGVPVVVTPAQLAAFAADHYPVYWAGERPQTQLEVTLTTKNAIFVRYLPDGVAAGDPGKYLTIGTYENIDGYTALMAAKPGVARVTHAQNGAVIAVFENKPLSTYFSFKNAGFQVEVFSPQGGESEQLTDDGSIRLVGSTA